MPSEEGVELNLLLTDATVSYLQELVRTGLYGDSNEQAAIALIDEGIRKAIGKNIIEPMKLF